MKEFIGKVVSTKMNKTVIVSVEHAYRHPLYRKSISRTKQFACHNESLALSVGDMVKIAEIKPKSRRKHFRIVEKIS